ncbi:sulfatase [Haloferula chungangensis]|uniref:Sulfatase n=1 Tax=Haloferula chungangensis TaxID=1048331 RepID=A0ABW2L5Y7_9BACT
MNDHWMRLDKVVGINRKDGTISGIGRRMKAFATGCLTGLVLAFAWGGLHAADKPNVIFIAVDDLNNWTGFAGHPDAITPNMDALASGGVHFSRAYCSYPLCGPSRASLMSGVYFAELNASKTQPSDSEVEERIEAMGSSLLHTYMGNHGYKTMAVGKILHNHVPSGSVDLSGGRDSWDFNENASGTRVRSNWPPDLNPDTAATLTDWGLYVGDKGAGTEADMSDSKSAEWAVARLQESHDEPFMLMVGFLHPHVPWYAPQKYFDMYDPAELTLPAYHPEDFDDIPSAGLDNINDGYPRTEWAIENDQWRNMVHAYLANVSYVDTKIGEVLDALESSPYASNTIVVLWGDHGYHMGEKNTFQKHTLWDRSGVTPLIIKAPGMGTNAECGRVVSLLDIYPTLLDLCELPPNEKLRGRSLRPLLESPASPWDFPAFTYKGGTKSVQYGDLRYIGYADGSQELYDHSEDPDEWTNLVDHEEYADSLAKLRVMSPFPEDTGSSRVFEFVDGSPLDAVGINGNMTVGGITITTRDVIGLDGSRASDGTKNVTNIGAPGGLGINSAVADTAKNFESDEGWEFQFDTNVHLESIDLLEMNAGGTLTLSSEGFPDIVLSGALNGLNDLGRAFVPAGTRVSIRFSHTGAQGTDGPRIMSLTVARELTAFMDWISTNYPSLTGVNALPDGDPDKDGVENLLEFALNGNPTSGSDSGAVFSTLTDADGDRLKELVLTLAVRNLGGSPNFGAGASGEQTATVDGLVYSVAGSFNLTNFSSKVSETAPVTGSLPPPPSGWEYRSFRLDASQGLPAGSLGFMWARVEEESP